MQNQWCEAAMLSTGWRVVTIAPQKVFFSHQFQKHAEWESPSSLGVATLRNIDVSIQGKVRTSPKAKLSASSLQLLQQKWIQVMQPICGHKSYSDMRKAVNAELSR